MKVFSTVMKIVAALAMIAGIVYVVATYGDKLVAWSKKLLGKFSCCCGGDECCCDEECCCEDDCCCEGDCCCEDDACQEVAAQEAAPTEDTAEEADFEG